MDFRHHGSRQSEYITIRIILHLQKLNTVISMRSIGNKAGALHISSATKINLY